MTPHELRAAIKGHTQRTAAAWLGIHPATIERYLAGLLPIPKQTAMLADMLQAGELPERYLP